MLYYRRFISWIFFTMRLMDQLFLDSTLVGNKYFICTSQILSWWLDVVVPCSINRSEYSLSSFPWIIVRRKVNFPPECRFQSMCRTPCTLEMRYRLIPLRGSNIVNLSIPSKPRLRTRFGWTMMKYTFKSPPPKLEMKGKMIDRNITGHTYRQI